MKNNFIIPLTTNSEQLHRLKSLQTSFVEICNAITPIIQASACWNRVALHHMAYHKMRIQFPDMGSQMICNAIYSVCRIARVMFQNPQSPWNIEKNPAIKLPKIFFLPQSPVFFDRHTLSIKGNRLSMYTLNGRIRFDLGLSEDEQNMFHHAKLKEVLLVNEQDTFSLHFHFGEGTPDLSQIGLTMQMPNNIQVIAH